MINKKIIQEIIKDSFHTNTLSKFACEDFKASRIVKEQKQSFRSGFAIDRDRILYSGAYRRYQGKTQVFSFTNFFDEEMTNRSVHTTYVSQIGRSIGKILGLNQELIESIALGHDLGHTPFGHAGEEVLSECCQKFGLGKFFHNIQSLRVVDSIAKGGRGLNLTFPTRDGIISHDGEEPLTKLVPWRDKSDGDISNYIKNKKSGKVIQWMPKTMEGCVVRIADTIAYVGQDVEDAVRLKKLDWKDLPENIINYLGDSNSKIVETLINSVIVNSYQKGYISLDKTTSQMLSELKSFNYENIYKKIDIGLKDKIKKGFSILFEKYMHDLEIENRESKIFEHFLDNKENIYSANLEESKNKNAQIVSDFISTMTDRYLNQELKNFLIMFDD